MVGLPPATYSFLATTPDGSLVATTFNPAAPGTPPQPLKPLLIGNPTSEQPKIVELGEELFDGQRGYSGAAVDSHGNIFISGDTGSATTSFVKKFTQTGQLDTLFATNGVLKPGRRCLGIATLNDRIYLAQDWGVVSVFDAATGKLVTSLPKASNFFVRDITIDPNSRRVFAVAGRKVGVWDPGKGATDIARYTWREIGPQVASSGAPLTCEGICLDPASHLPLTVPPPGNELVMTSLGPQEARSPLDGVESDSHIGDVAISADGEQLFASELRRQTIHVYKRSVMQFAAAAVATTAPPRAPATAPALPAATPPAASTVGRPEKSPPQQAVEAPPGGDFAPVGEAEALGAKGSTGTPAGTPPAVAAPAAASAAASPVARVDWIRTYSEAIKLAGTNGKPILVYIRRQDDGKSPQFEEKFLLSDEFNSKAARFVCVFEDMGNSHPIADRFGVVSTPYVLFVNSKGEPIAAPDDYQTTREGVLALMDSIK